MGMLVDKKQVGFGQRSWRYCAIINDGVVEKWWQEDGMNNEGSDPDPYNQTTPENCIEYLSKKKDYKLTAYKKVLGISSIISLSNWF